jgi:hypothetical protein
MARITPSLSSLQPANTVRPAPELASPIQIQGVDFVTYDPSMGIPMPIDYFIQLNARVPVGAEAEVTEASYDEPTKTLTLTVRQGAEGQGALEDRELTYSREDPAELFGATQVVVQLEDGTELFRGKPQERYERAGEHCTPMTCF